MINGIALAGLSEYVKEVEVDSAEACARYGVVARWQTGTRGEVQTLPMALGRHRIARDFRWTIDEPRPLLGTNHGPTPQEMLLGGVASCLMVAYAVGASVMCIRLDHLAVNVRGALDLRGFLGVDPQAPVGFESIHYEVEIDGDGTPQQFETLHAKVTEHSPNRMTVAQGVPVHGVMLRREPSRATA